MIQPTKLTYSQCEEIIEENGDLLFYKSETFIDSFKVVIFNYRMARYEHFIKPLKNSDINALEMRGLTFIFNKDGTLYKRYFMLSKFFNLNQVPISLYSEVKDYTISSIMNKEDGSLISFVKLPNDEIYARSKMSFESPQAISANELYNSNKSIKDLVNWSFDNDKVLFFEYVSFDNRVVLEYDKSNLILINSRDNKTGLYERIDSFNSFGVDLCEYEDNITLDDIIKRSETEIDKEGEVITFTNGFMIKIKTQWYRDLHHLTFGVATRENDIIRLIIEDEIDDVISQLHETDISKRKFINDIVDKVGEKIEFISTEIDARMLKFDGDKKKFAIEFMGDDYMHYCMSIINGSDKFEKIKKRILTETRHLKQARKWLST